MCNGGKTRDQLLAENAELRQRLAACSEMAPAAERYDPSYRLKNQDIMGAFFSSGLQGIILANQDRVIYANEAFLQIAGYNRQDLLEGRMEWCFLTPPEYATIEERVQQELFNHGIFNPYEKELIRKDGSRIPILMGGTLVQYRPFQFIGFVLDVTSRKEAEDNIRRDQRRLKELVIERTRELGEERRRTADILEKVSEAFFAFDREGRITFMNQAAEMMFFIKRERLLGKSFWEVFPEGMGDLLRDKFLLAMREKRPVVFESFSQDTNRYAEARIYPAGEGVSLFFNDITERKWMVGKWGYLDG